MRLRISLDLTIGPEGVQFLGPPAWCLLDRDRRGPLRPDEMANAAATIGDVLATLPDLPPCDAADAVPADYDAKPSAATRTPGPSHLAAGPALPDDVLRALLAWELQPGDIGKMLTEYGERRIVKLVNWIRDKARTEGVSAPRALLLKCLAKGVA